MLKLYCSYFDLKVTKEDEVFERNFNYLEQILRQMSQALTENLLIKINAHVFGIK